MTEIELSYGLYRTPNRREGIKTVVKVHLPVKFTLGRDVGFVITISLKMNEYTM